MSGLREIDYALQKLDWMRSERIWPNGLRYLWTDAFGLVLLVSLYQALNEERYLDQAEWLVAEVNRVLGRPRGIRIGEEADRDGNISITSPCGSSHSRCSDVTGRPTANRVLPWRARSMIRSSSPAAA
jgi:hypothetical protein